MLAPEWLRVASGYEAAAELLADGADLLVVDLARLSAAHVPLLDLARRRAVPVLAFGTPRADISDLSHVRLTTAGNLVAAARAIARVAKAADAPAKVETKESPASVAPAAPEPKAEPAPEKTPPPAKLVPRVAPTAKTAEPSAPASAGSPAPTQGRRGGPAELASGCLTAEEIAALLGKKP